MSVLTLPEPANWPAGRIPLAKTTLLVAVLVLAGIFTAAHQFLLGRNLEASFAIAFLVPFVLLVAVIHVAARRDTSLRASYDATGTLLRPDLTLTWLVMTAIGSFVPLGLAGVVLTLTGHLHLFASQRAQAGAVVGMALLAGTAISGLLTAWRRGGVGYVKLTPAGIDIADIKRTQSVAWDDVLEVADHSESNKKTRKAIVLRLGDGTEKTIDGADLYVPNGIGLYWMVRHYWRHADDRAELTDERGLERLRDGRFDLT